MTKPDVVLDLDLDIPTNNKLMRMHFSGYDALKKQLMWHLMMAVRGIPKEVQARMPFKVARLRIIKYGPRVPDMDNVFGGMKPLIDLLRPRHRTSGVYKTGKKKGQRWVREQGFAGIIQDDNAHQLKLEADWVKDKHPHVRLEITEILAEPKTGS